MEDERIQDEVTVSHRFAIDLGWFPDHMRSFVDLAQSRMCESCQAKVGTETEERVPRPDASGKVVFETVRTRYGSDPFAVIAECCSQKPEYHSSRLPVMEIVFRLFLANRNQPIALEDLTQEVLEWVRPGDGRVINPTVIDRLVLADEYYGIRQIEEALPANLAATTA